MLETDLVLIYTRKLAEAGFEYMITGSVAGVVYGEPRVTHDVDLVVSLSVKDAKRVTELFPIEDFYCPPQEIIEQEARRAQRGHFNLIHHGSGFKADVYLANQDPFHRWAMAERRRIDLDGDPIEVAPLELRDRSQARILQRRPLRETHSRHRSHAPRVVRPLAARCPQRVDRRNRRAQRVANHSSGVALLPDGNIGRTCNNY